MRTKLMLMFSVLLILSACSGESSSKESESDEQEHESASTEQQPEDDDGANQEEEDKSDEEKDGTFEPKEPEYKMTDDYYVEPIDDADPEVVLLTIDDAPEDHAVEMAETLDDLDAPAIFYINKMFVDEEDGEEKLKKIHDMGFAIGNHTDTHPDLSELSEEEQKEEVNPVYDQIEDITGDPAKFFRAPHGVNTDVSNDIAEEKDAMVMNWSYGYDFKPDYEDADKLEEAMLNPDPPGLLRDGAILLMHDRDWTNEALENIVEGLRDQGYEILDPALLETPQSSG